MALPRISEKLEDADMGVISATINIICELSRNDIDNAKLFLTMSPQFFHLLTSSSNNWMLIKIIKLFGVLTPLEPRLVRKLIPSITQIISTTPAMSLLYECIHTMIIGGMFVGSDGDSLAATCVEKLATFLDDDDQNLKYIALLALTKLIPTHPHLVALHQEEIFDAMEDDDLSIRLRALDLVSGMASRANFRSIVDHQLRQMESEKTHSKTSAIASLKSALTAQSNPPLSTAPWLTTSYRLEIITRILNLGSRDTYSIIVDFEWYVDILIKLAYIANGSAGTSIQSQIIDIASRVRGVRGHAISKLKQVLENAKSTDPVGQEFELLQAAAWICGEYCQEVSYPPAIITLLLDQEILKTCSHRTVCMMHHNAVKLFAWWLLQLSNDWRDENLQVVKQMTAEIQSALQQWQHSEDIDLEERAVEYQQLLTLLAKDLESFVSHPQPPLQQTGDAEQWLEKAADAETTIQGPKSLQLLSPLFFAYTLGPVAKKAQSKVIKPAELDLESWIVDPREMSMYDPWEEEDRQLSAAKKEKSKKSGQKHSREGRSSLNGSSDDRGAEFKERARLKLERLKRQQDSPFYIGSTGERKNGEVYADDIDEIPIVQLQLDDIVQPDNDNEKAMVKDERRPAMTQEVEEMPEEAINGVQVVRKKVGTRKKKKSKAVGEASLL